jgi:rhamnulokinase
MPKSTSVYLAFDLGAESGRVVAGTLAGGTLAIREVHRFANEPVRAGGSLRWDVLRLWHEMQRGLQIARAETPTLAGIGVDTWGVDYALIGPDGSLVENPYHYRDARTDGVPERLFRILPADEIYQTTGIQFMQINTLFQVFATAERNPGLLRYARHLVTMPDLLNYWLTGRIACEFTNATTTQMFDARTRTWATSMVQRLGIPEHLLTDIVEPGTHLGEIDGVPVIAPACHDTGSAVAAVNSTGKTVFISSGTWSLMGAEIGTPIISPEARELNFTNEGGVGGTFRLLKNITGMWLLQGCRREWEPVDYATLVGLASPEPSLRSLVDPNHPAFLHPASMTRAIRDYCRATGQPEPADRREFVQSIFESLALMYRSVLDSLESLTGTRFEEIRVVGGGARNKLLNQYTADATGRRVIAGPIEATALGNIAMQMVTTGAVSSIQDARAVIDRSFPTELFKPAPAAAWDDAYARFRGAHASSGR